MTALPAPQRNTPCAKPASPDFFSPDPRQVTAAKAVCASCPILDACREYALTNDAVGVWGGTDDSERNRIRRERALPKPVPVSDWLDELIVATRSSAPRPALPQSRTAGVPDGSGSDDAPDAALPLDSPLDVDPTSDVDPVDYLTAA